MMNKFSCLFAIAVLALLLSIAGINKTPLQGSTEPREAGVAAEMLQDGDYWVPRLNGTPFLEKPPLSYWLQSASIHAFGYQYWAPRLPSLLAGFACALLVYFYLAQMTGRSTIGAAGAGLLLTMASYWLNSRTAGQDILLTLGVGLALFGFYFVRESRRPGWQWLLYCCGLALATMTKGIIGLAIPGVAIFTFLLAETVLQRRFELRAWLLPGVLAMLALLPFAGWLYVLQQHIGADAVREILWSNSVSRFAGDYTKGAHAEPFYYYLAKLLEMFQPWAILLAVAIWQLSANLSAAVRQQTPLARRTLFFICWLCGPFLLLSLSAGKRPSYLLMLYPAAAALIALFIDRLVTSAKIAASAKTTELSRQNNQSSQQNGELAQQSIRKRLPIIYALIFAGSGVFVVARVFKAHVPIAALILLVTLCALTFLLWRAQHRREWRNVGATSLALMACIYIAYGLYVLPRGIRDDAVTPIFQRAMQLHAAGTTIALYRPMERVAGAARFYLQQPADELDTTDQAARLWQRNPSAVLIVDISDIGLFATHHVLERITSGKRGFALIAN